MKRLFSVFVPFAFWLSSSGQSVPVNLKEDTPPYERIYLHTDQSFYVAGEMIWLKAYLYSPFVNNSFSTNLFVEIINEKNKIICRGKFAVLGERTIGSLQVPDTTSQGAYILRAYTVAALNYGKVNVFTKGIFIFNPLSTTIAPNTEKLLPACDIFPEGGSIISKVQNNIAFKLSVPGAEKQRFRGTLIDKQGKDLLRVATDSSGRGQFRFVPAADEEYRIKIILPGQSPLFFDLPPAKQNGIALQLTDNPGEKTFIISRSGKESKELDSLRLVAIMFNRVVNELHIDMTGEKFVSGKIRTEILPRGRMQVLVFDKENKLLAYRDCFVSGNYQDKMELITDTVSFSPHSMNSYRLLFEDSVFADLSVSVIPEEDAMPGGLDILNGIFLQPGMKNGYPTMEGTDDPDLFMLTSQWEIDTSKGIKNYREDKFLKISGRFDFKSGKEETVPEIMFIAETRDSLQTFFTVPLSPDRRFEISNLVFEDTATFYYQLKAKKPVKNVKLVLQKDSTDFSKALIIADYRDIFSSLKKQTGFFETNPGLKSRLKNRYDAITVRNARGITLEEVIVKAKRTSSLEKVNRKYTSGIFSSMANVRTVDLEANTDNAGYPNIFEYLKGKIAGLFIGVRGGSYYIESPRSRSTLDVLQGGNGLVDGLIYLNESQVPPEVLANVPVNQIALVKFFPPGSLQSLPGVGISCVLAVYTKTGESLKDTREYLGKFNYPGYSVTKPFVPEDEAPVEKQSRELTRTVFWKPDIQLNGEKELRIRFFSPMAVKGYRIIAEGINSKGQLIHYETKILPPLKAIN